MRIDAYTHYYPKRFFDKMMEIAGDYKDMGKRMRGVPALYDLDVRKGIVDMFPDYCQILSYPMPPLEELAKGAPLAELLKLVNDGFADICAKEHDRFPGWVGQTSLALPDAGVAEAERALKAGALGVQIYTNVNGSAIDHAKYEPFWAKMNELGKPIFLHPARGPNVPDYMDETKSKYEIFLGARLVLRNRRRAWRGWCFRRRSTNIRTSKSSCTTSAASCRCWKAASARAGTRSATAPPTRIMALKNSLKKRPLDYQTDFYADTAAFTARAATVCGLDFYPIDKVIFASDCPFDPEKGTMYIRETLKILDSLPMSKADRDKICIGRTSSDGGVKLVK
jgi:aminocarboxymuconate-semialdehyde decarboxylase